MSDAPTPAPSKLRAYMAAPLALSALALLGALWVMFKLQNGRPPAGERVTMSLVTSCAAQSGPVILRRAETVGLGDPVSTPTAEGLSLTVTLPGLPDDRTAIPALLLAPGHLEIHAAGRTVATEEDVTGTALNMDAGGSPYAELSLNGLAMAELREATKDESGFEVLMDGVSILKEEKGSVRDEKLRLTPERAPPGMQMRTVVDWTILLGSGALPCPVTLGALATAPAEG